MEQPPGQRDAGDEARTDNAVLDAPDDVFARLCPRARVAEYFHFVVLSGLLAYRVFLEWSFLFAIILYYQELEKSSEILKLFEKFLKLW